MYLSIKLPFFPEANRFSIFLILLAFLGMAGCNSKDMSDLQDYVTKVKSQSKVEIEPLPEIKAVEPYVFGHNEDLHDPFITDEKIETPEEERIESGVRPDTNRPKEELEAFELDSLRMVGTIVRDGGLWGLVKTSDGTVHRVSVGNYMGKNYGKVVNIKDNVIEIVETITENPGVWQERKAGLSLAESGGQSK